MIQNSWLCVLYRTVRAANGRRTKGRSGLNSRKTSLSALNRENRCKFTVETVSYPLDRSKRSRVENYTPISRTPLVLIYCRYKHHAYHIAHSRKLQCQPKAFLHYFFNLKISIVMKNKTIFVFEF
jgi:hypothetical protein